MKNTILILKSNPYFKLNFTYKKASRVALLHSLANIEQWAIDLSWDIIARFSSVEFPDKTKLPKEFFSDWVKVARDEAKVGL